MKSCLFCIVIAILPASSAFSIDSSLFPPDQHVADQDLNIRTVKNPSHSEISNGQLSDEREGEYIVIHSTKSVLAATRERFSRGAFAPNSGLNPGVSRAQQATVKSFMTSQVAAVRAEQSKFKRKLRSLAMSDQPKLSSVRQVLNATIMRGVPRAVAQRLKAQGFNIVQARRVQAELSESVPFIGADQVWQLNDHNGHLLTGRDTRVGIIDTGIDYTHADLGACTTGQFLSQSCAKVVGGYDFVNDDADPMDDHFHGTHVAATVAGNGYYKGVAPDAKLIAYKVLGATGSGSSADIIEAIERSIDPNQDDDSSDHLDVINLSLGSNGGNPDSPDSLALDEAMNAGVVAVVAAGNSGPGESTIGSPGTSREAITVAATNNSGVITSFSSRGPVVWDENILIKPDIAGPGAGICAAMSHLYSGGSNCGNGTHLRLNGTSMATPHVAGLAALIKQANVTLTAREVKSIILSTARELINPSTGVAYLKTEQGNGLVQAEAAVEAALSGAVPPLAQLFTTGSLSGDSVAIIGTVAGDDFESYTVEFRSNDAGVWSLIGGGSSLVTNGTLVNWNISGLASTSYQLRLTVHTASHSATNTSSVVVKNVAIKSPISPDTSIYDHDLILSAARRVPIVGSARGANFSHYSIEICWHFTDQEGCSDAGVELQAAGASQVLNDALGSFRVSELPVVRSGLYEIKLHTHFGDSRPSETATREVYVDTRLLENFPPELPFTCSKSYCFDYGEQPILADLNGDGKKEILIALDSTLHVIQSNGEELPGWPMAVNKPLMVPVQAADLDNNGSLEVVVEGYSFAGSNIEGTIFVFKSDGSSFPGWPKNYSMSITSPKHLPGEPLTIVDLNGDGQRELIVGPTEVYNKDGSAYGGWPSSLTDVPVLAYKGIAVGDLDGDSQPELVWVGTDWQSWNTSDIEHSMLVIQSHTGALVSALEFDGISASAPILAKLDHSGSRSIVFALRENHEGVTRIYALDSQGNNKPGWPVSITNVVLGHYLFVTGFAAADFDGDGLDQIVFDSEIPTHLINHDGTIATGFPLGAHGSVPLSIANVDGDPAPEILIADYYTLSGLSGEDFGGSRGKLAVLRAINADGSFAPGFPLLAPRPYSFFPTFAAGDLDGDSKNEIVFASASQLWAWSTGGCANEPEAWPGLRANSDHTGVPGYPISGWCTTDGFAADCAVDSDLDFLDDCQDLCPDNRYKSTPSEECGCNNGESDADSDGVLDCNDLCPNSHDKTAPGTCGCFVADTDTNQNGIVDCVDNSTPPPPGTPTPNPTPGSDDGDTCPQDPSKTSPGICGCGTLDRDYNRNGVMDCTESPSVPRVKTVGRTATVTGQRAEGARYEFRIQIGKTVKTKILSKATIKIVRKRGVSQLVSYRWVFGDISTGKVSSKYSGSVRIRN